MKLVNRQVIAILNQTLEKLASSLNLKSTKTHLFSNKVVNTTNTWNFIAVLDTKSIYPGKETFEIIESMCKDLDIVKVDNLIVSSSIILINIILELED